MMTTVRSIRRNVALLKTNVKNGRGRWMPRMLRRMYGGKHTIPGSQTAHESYHLFESCAAI